MDFLKKLFGGEPEKNNEKNQKNKDKDFDILKYDGLRALQNGQPEYARTCLEHALEIKEDPEALGFLAQALLHLHENEEALGILSRISELMPENVQAHLNVSRIAGRIKNYPTMEAAADQALKIEAKNAEALCLKAEARRENGDLLNAIALLTQATMNDPNLESAYLLRAGTLVLMGQLQNAEEDIDYLLEHFEIKEDYLLRKAEIRHMRGDLEQAIAYFIKVKEANPFNREAYLGLSQAYSENHQLDKALETDNEAIDLIQDFAAGYKERGRIKMLLNDKEGALKDLKRALALDPHEGRELEGLFSNLDQYNAENKE